MKKRVSLSAYISLKGRNLSFTESPSQQQQDASVGESAEKDVAEKGKLTFLFSSDILS